MLWLRERQDKHALRKHPSDMRYETKRTLGRIAFLAVAAWTIMSFLFLGLIIYLYQFSISY